MCAREVKLVTGFAGYDTETVKRASSTKTQPQVLSILSHAPRVIYEFRVRHLQKLKVPLFVGDHYQHGFVCKTCGKSYICLQTYYYYKSCTYDRRF